MFGFTGDETGSNLPTEFAPRTCSAGGTVLIASNIVGMSGIGLSAVVFAAVKKDGFYIVRSETIAGMTGLPRVR